MSRGRKLPARFLCGGIRIDEHLRLAASFLLRSHVAHFSFAASSDSASRSIESIAARSSSTQTFAAAVSPAGMHAATAPSGSPMTTRDSR